MMKAELAARRCYLERVFAIVGKGVVNEEGKRRDLTAHFQCVLRIRLRSLSANLFLTVDRDQMHLDVLHSAQKCFVVQWSFRRPFS